MSSQETQAAALLAEAKQRAGGNDRAVTDYLTGLLSAVQLALRMFGAEQASRTARQRREQAAAQERERVEAAKARLRAEQELAAMRPERRCTSADRDAAADALQRAYSVGALDPEELNDRLSKCLLAKWPHELAELTSDLPELAR